MGYQGQSCGLVRQLTNSENTPYFLENLVTEGKRTGLRLCWPGFISDHECFFRELLEGRYLIWIHLKLLVGNGLQHGSFPVVLLRLEIIPRSKHDEGFIC